MTLGIGHQDPCKGSHLTGYTLISRRFEPGVSVLGVVAPELRVCLTLERVSILSPFVPGMGHMLRDLFLFSHFHTLEVPVQDHPTGHEEARRFIVRLWEFTPGMKIGGSSNGSPILIKGGNSDQVWDIYIFDEVLGFFPDVKELTDAIRCEIFDAGDTTHHKGLEMGIFRTKNGVHPDCLGLQAKGLDVMGSGHQVGLRREFVGRMSPVGIVKWAQLATVHKGLDPLLDTLIIRGTTPWCFTHIVRQSSRLFGIGL